MACDLLIAANIALASDPKPNAIFFMLFPLLRSERMTAATHHGLALDEQPENKIR
jgi:hypothetical protein